MKSEHVCESLDLEKVSYDVDFIITIADFVSQHHDGDILETVVEFAAKHFGIDYVHVALLNDTSSKVKVIAAYLDGSHLEPGYVYELVGTPCQNVVNHDHKCYLDRVQELFPQDHDLKELDAQGYIGEPIDDGKGNSLGLIVLVSREPLESSLIIVAGMRILAGYISSYLETQEIKTQELQNRKLLEEKESLLNTVINQIPDILVVKDENAKFVLTNEALANLYDTKPELMIGKDNSDFGVPHELSEFMRKNVLDIMAKGKMEIVYEDSQDATTNEIHHFRSIKKPFKTADGKDRILVIAQDLTDLIKIQKQLQEKRDQLQTILQTTRDAFWYVDQNGNLIDVNEAMSDMLGYSREELLSMHISEIDATENIDDVNARIKLIQKDGSARFEVVHRHKNGNLLNVDVSVTYIPSQGFYIAFIRDITEQKLFEQELEHQRGFLRTLINTIPDLVWLKDINGVYMACNPRFESFFGATEKELVGKTDYDFVDKELADFFRKHDKAAIEKGSSSQNEELITFAVDGHQEILSTTKTPMYDSHGNILGVLGVGHDVTSQRTIEDRLKESEKSFRSLFDSLQEAVYVQDKNGTFIEVNEGAVKMYGYPKEWFIGKNPLSLSAPNMNDLDALIPAHKRAMNGEPQSFEFWAARADGTIFPKEVHQTKGRWLGDEVVFAVALDITERKKHEQQLQHIAHYDSLTGLPNRLLLADRLHQAMAHAKRQNQLLAIAYLDLDGFKTVNDTYGHDVGDHLLVNVAKELKKALRDGDTLARLGGDEFVAVLVDFENRSVSANVLERLLEAVIKPVTVNDLELNVSASIGVTFFPQSDGVDADQLIRQSDQAMYEAKQSGKNRFAIFDAQNDKNVRGRHESLQHISMALQKKEFVLYYQPKVNLRSGELIGVEALIRWQHPQKGILAPANFLPIIAHHQLSIELGEWVLEEALSQIEDWKAKGVFVPVSVNLDGMQLQQFDFVEKLQIIMNNYPNVESNDLELEVLETSAIEDIKQVSNVIDGCKDIGIDFALDDFGTGYSSLTYLKRLPVSTLKIDKSFVIDMLDDPEDLAILEGVIGLANVFNRKVIAEGVESREHADMLLRIGCELAQGYGIAKPMSAGMFEEWVKIWKPDPRWQSIKSMEREEIRALYAIAEHRGWLNKVIEYVEGERLIIPTLDIDKCQFAVWSEKFKKQHLELSQELVKLDTIHIEVHTLAESLMSSLKELTTEKKSVHLQQLKVAKESFITAVLKLIDQ